MNATRIGVVGAGGRMGRMLIEAVLKGEGVVLGAAFDVPGSQAIGKNAGELVGLPADVLITDDVAAGLKQIDVLIDFTRPQGTLVHLLVAADDEDGHVAAAVADAHDVLGLGGGRGDSHVGG